MILKPDSIGAMEGAVDTGYRSLRIDTVPSMAAAIALYRKNGFVTLDVLC